MVNFNLHKFLALNLKKKQSTILLLFCFYELDQTTLIFYFYEKL